MNAPEHWRRVEDLYHAALDLPDGERARFVRESCAGDEALQRELESLLAYECNAETFLRQPALDVLPGAPPATRMTLGYRLGPYEIVSFIGAGGMGDVYRARDIKLGRDVAIKILPDVFAADANRRARFDREARLLASLNHPHIGAIYGFEERDGIHGLVLELVEGRTLAERIREGPLEVSQALTIARQIADALLAAHAKGIVHRDLKPANVALTRDDAAKVLDFGLAKSIVDGSDDDPTHSSSVASGSDVVVGTAAYMSPEQARGEPVDERTDIWAFGCVVWAMLTGRPPFAGDTISRAIEAILDREPDWSSLPLQAHPGIVHLLQQCLEKDPARRLQRIADARAELDRVLAGSIDEVRSPYLPRGWAGAGALAAAATAVAALVSTLLVGAPTGPRTDVTFTQITHFTDSAVAPAVSPDGRMVAFVRGERHFGNTGSIYLKPLPDGATTELVQDPRPKYGIAFSPDGSKIVYTTSPKGWTTYSVDVRGGEPELLLTNAGGVTWLDQRRFLFSETKTGFHMGIVAATRDRSEHRELYFPRHERSMAHYSFASPDRKWALVVEMDYRPVWQPCRLIPLDGSSGARLVGPTGQCSSAGWSPDGRWMYFTAVVGEESHLWRQRFPHGEPEQLTFGPTQEEGVAVAPDGSVITSAGLAQSAIWVRDSSGERALTSEGDIVWQYGSYSYPSFSPDGKRLHYLRRDARSATAELWRTDLASGESSPLLPGARMQQYNVSPDQSQVVFTTEPAGKPSELWVAALDRSAPPRRIASSGENSPFFGPSGELLFRFTDGTANYLGRINADGSGRTRVVEYPIGTVQNISPDRRWLVAITPRLDRQVGATSMAIPTTGGAPRQICVTYCYCAWSSDGRFLYVEVEPRSQRSTGRMIALPVSPETGLPDLPDAGIESAAQAAAIPGSWIVAHTGTVPGPDRDTYASVRTTVHRNLFRITHPEFLPR